MQKSAGLFTARQNGIVLALILLGAAAFGVGLWRFPERAWLNFLISDYFFLSLSLVGGVFIAIQYLVKAGWPVVFRRIPEAMTAYLPVGGILMLLFLFGMPEIYAWARPEVLAHDPLLREKGALLNVPGVLLRMAFFLVLWVLLARSLVRNSIAQDEDGAIEHTYRNIRTSTLFAILFMSTFALTTIEWIMSLEPHWYSTIFPWYVISSVFVSGVALLTLILLWMRRGGRFVEVNAHHLHDLGKYVFAFSFFWGYIWFSQFLLIWYTNIGEEAVYYATRMREGWYPLFLLDVGVNFLLPFAILLPAKTKQNPTVLGGVSLLVLLGHWLDFYLLVMPATMKGAPVFGWIEVAIFLGVGALFLLFCDRGLRRAALLPSKDPLFAESVHHHES